MNILSFDIEEWYIEKAFNGGRQEQYGAFDKYLEGILDLLDEQKTQATFFVVGKMAECFPHVVKRIEGQGHDIGCHSNTHTWLNKMTREEVYQDTRQAVDSLEQCIGKKVKSYRAPAFSIGKSNQWAFEVLAQCGIECDASVFPATRDFGGFPDFGNQVPTLISTGAGDIKEFPIVTARILGKDIAFSGGGYFRFFPLWFVTSQMKKRDYNICYFHIGDLILSSKKMMTRAEYEDYFKEPGTWLNRYKRHLKSSLGKKTALERMNQLIRNQRFISIPQAVSQIDWTTTPRIVIQ